MKFSQRHGFDPNRAAGPIVREAPDWLRREYLVKILSKLTYIDMDSRYKNEEKAPLGIKALHERISIDTRRTMDENDWDSWHCSEALESTILACEWYQFYDSVETVGEMLRDTESKYEIDKDLNDFLGEPSYEHFSFGHYREAVNNLFQKHVVGWRMNSKGNLETALPKDLADRVTSVEKKLSDDFESARIHYSKARSYILGTGKDPENSIKESISAIESVCRVFYPKAASLGKALDFMKADPIFPPRLLTVLQKLYDYANDEPGVRHGSRHTPKVAELDAELVLHIATALIRYVIEAKKSPPLQAE